MVNEKGVTVTRKEGKNIRRAINAIGDTIENELEKGGDLEVCELWVLHRERTNKHFEFENGDKNRSK